MTEPKPFLVSQPHNYTCPETTAITLLADMFFNKWTHPEQRDEINEDIQHFLEGVQFILQFKPQT
jgi:hypothetical protein